MSNGIVLAATTPGAPHVTPPSKDRLNAIVFAAVSFQAAYTSPFGPPKGTAAITRPRPEGSSTRVTVNVAPWSVHRAQSSPPLEDPPLATSHATYTLSLNG